MPPLATAKSPAFVPVTVRPVTFNVPVPVLLMVTVCAALVVPMLCAAKLRLVGEKLTLGVPPVETEVPIPLSATAPGEPVALWAIDRLAVSAAATEGLKVTLTEQLAPAATLVFAQPLAAKSAAFVPPTEIAPTLSAALPVLEIFTLSAALVEPTCTLPRDKLMGLIDATGAGITTAVPVPPSVTLCGLLGALLTMEKLAARVPAAAGVKVAPRVQLAPAATEPAAQVPLLAKSPMFVPPSVMLEIVNAAVPVLDSVTV